MLSSMSATVARRSAIEVRRSRLSQTWTICGWPATCTVRPRPRENRLRPSYDERPSPTRPNHFRHSLLIQIPGKYVKKIRLP